MPYVNIKLIEGVFDDDQKQEMLTRITETMVDIEGEAMRPVTWVTIEEVHSGEWCVGGKALTTQDVKDLRAELSHATSTSNWRRAASLRPSLPDDAPRLVAMFERCSPAVALRPVPRPGPALPGRAPRRRGALVAHPPVVGDRRPRHRPARRRWAAGSATSSFTAEVGLLVEDAAQRQGLGTELLDTIADERPRRRHHHAGRDHAGRVPPRAPHARAGSARRRSRAPDRPATCTSTCRPIEHGRLRSAGGELDDGRAVGGRADRASGRTELAPRPGRPRPRRLPAPGHRRRRVGHRQDPPRPRSTRTRAPTQGRGATGPLLRPPRPPLPTAPRLAVRRHRRGLAQRADRAADIELLERVRASASLARRPTTLPRSSSASAPASSSPSPSSCSSTCSTTPSVVFVDDVDWADAATVDLLRHLMFRLDDVSVPLLVLATSRADPTPRRRGGGRPPALRAPHRGRAPPLAHRSSRPPSSPTRAASPTAPTTGPRPRRPRAAATRSWSRRSSVTVGSTPALFGTAPAHPVLAAVGTTIDGLSDAAGRAVLATAVLGPDAARHVCRHHQRRRRARGRRGDRRRRARRRRHHARVPPPDLRAHRVRARRRSRRAGHAPRAATVVQRRDAPIAHHLVAGDAVTDARRSGVCAPPPTTPWPAARGRRPPATSRPRSPAPSPPSEQAELHRRAGLSRRGNLQLAPAVVPLRGRARGARARRRRRPPAPSCTCGGSAAASAPRRCWAWSRDRGAAGGAGRRGRGRPTRARGRGAGRAVAVVLGRVAR